MKTDSQKISAGFRALIKLPRMIQPPDIREELSTLATALVPGVEFYILFFSDNPPHEHGMDCATGWTGPTLDLALRGWLTAIGRWKGRRPAIVLDDTHFWGNGLAASRGEQDVADYIFRQHATGVLVHELGHTIDVGVERSEPTPDLELLAKAINSRACPAYRDYPVPWLGHGATWIRTALHLRFRALQIGHVMELGTVFSSDKYSLSHPYRYWGALLPEMKWMVDVPIFELAATSPTAEFVDLWRADVKRWRDSQEHLTERVAAICGDAISIFGD
jgi:hypothetical protein